MSGGNDEKREKNNFRAWAKPKFERQRLINSMLQLGGNFVFCFRAKEKSKPDGGKIRDIGWMPIAGAEFLFEMTINFLLPPASDGVPTWSNLSPEQELFLKAPPVWARELLRDPKQLDESMGEFMAKWAAGDVAAPKTEEAKASKANVTALLGRLEANGLKAPELRAQWIVSTVGRTLKSPADLTVAECAMCLASAVFAPPEPGSEG